MALKSDRTHIASYIDFFMNETAERGVFVVQSTAGSGSAMDQSQQLATVAAYPSGKHVLGVLMCDMVNLDLTRQHPNWHKEEVQKGGKVTIWNQGQVVTNRIYPGVTPTAGAKAYLAHSGLLHTSTIIPGDGDALLVGRFMSTKDEDGYAKVSFNLP